MPTAKRRSEDQDDAPPDAPDANQRRTSSGKRRTARRKPRLLTADEQETYLKMMRLGAPPLLASQKLDVTPGDVDHTRDRVPSFDKQLDEVDEHLAANVTSALYKSAMEGSVSAQSQFLKQRPPEPIAPSALLPGADEATLIRRIAQLSAKWMKEHDQRDR